MKHFHSITIKNFTKTKGNSALDEELILSIIPFSLTDENINLEKEEVKGFQEKTITIHKVRLEKDRHINTFMDKFLAQLSLEQKSLLIEQKNRLDDQLNFFIRLDKSTLQDKKCEFTDGGDCIHLTFSVAAFPKKRQIALDMLKEIFK